MFKSILKRIALMFPLMIVVSFMTFLLTYITDENPAVTILHAQRTPGVTPESITETNERYGFSDPLLIQYKNQSLKAMQFNFDTGCITGDPVAERIGPAFMSTLELTIISSVMVMVTSIILGVVGALKRRKFTDRAVRSVTFFLTALPSYWIVPILIIYVSVKLNILLTSGLAGPKNYILSVIVITIAHAGIYFRSARRSMVEQLNKGYVPYLRVSGVKPIILMLHVLRNALQVAVSTFCMSMPMIMDGLVVIEYVFAQPGLGRLSLKTILGRGFPVIQAYILIVAVLFIVFNTLTDIINALLNPRLREGTR